MRKGKEAYEYAIELSKTALFPTTHQLFLGLQVFIIFFCFYFGSFFNFFFF